MKSLEKDIEKSLARYKKLAILKITIIYGLLISLIVWLFLGMDMIKPFVDNYLGIK